MMDRYDEQRQQLKDRKPWVANDKKSGNPPSVMTVTHVNQTKDLYVCCVMLSALNIFCYYEYVSHSMVYVFVGELTEPLHIATVFLIVP